MELKEVWNNEDARVICHSTVAAATTRTTINEISLVK